MKTFPNIILCHNSILLSDADKKPCVEQAFRDHLRALTVSDAKKILFFILYCFPLQSKGAKTPEYILLLNLAVAAVQKGFASFAYWLFYAYSNVSDICGTSTLFMMLSDLFDSITLDQCDIVFKYVDDKVSLWKSVRTYFGIKYHMSR
jgi:hypothetical protein